MVLNVPFPLTVPEKVVISHFGCHLTDHVTLKSKILKIVILHIQYKGLEIGSISSISYGI